MLYYLTILALFSIIPMLAVLGFAIKEKNYKELFYFLTTGILVGFADLMLEYLGTRNGAWTYNESFYFIFGTVPIELIILFFSSGIIARFIFVNYNMMKIPVKANVILGILIILSFSSWFRQMYMGIHADIMILMILIGLFGAVNISRRNRDAAVVLAFCVAFLDLVAETVIIGSGSYGYANGFNIYIPLQYALFVFGFLAVLEKLNKIDALLDHTFIKGILHAFGVYREKYTAEFEKINRRVKLKINNGKKILRR